MTPNAKKIIQQRNHRFGISKNAHQNSEGRNVNFVNITPKGGKFKYLPNGQIYPTPVLSSFLNCLKPQKSTFAATDNTTVDGEFVCD